MPSSVAPRSRRAPKIGRKTILGTPKSINIVTGIALSLAAATSPVLWILICKDFWSALSPSDGTAQGLCMATLGVGFIVLGLLSAYGSIRAFRGTLWRHDSLLS